MKQFGRDYKITISTGGSMIEITPPLQVSFGIRKAKTEEPDELDLQIHNLKSSTIKEIVNAKKATVTITAGYLVSSMIFTGDITEAYVIREGVDTILAIKAGDGQEVYSKARVNATIKAGATIDDELKTVAGATPYKRTKRDGETIRALPRAKVYNKPLREIMRDLARRESADWGIEDGEIKVIPKAIPSNVTVELSSDSGLIGGVEQTSEGCRVKCLLNPLLKIGAKLSVKSDFGGSGDYKITEIQHSADYSGAEWYSYVTGEHIKNGAKSTA